MVNLKMGHSPSTLAFPRIQTIFCLGHLCTRAQMTRNSCLTECEEKSTGTGEEWSPGSVNYGEKIVFPSPAADRKRHKSLFHHGTWGPYLCRSLYRLCPAPASVLLQAFEGARDAQFVAVVACLEVDSRGHSLRVGEFMCFTRHDPRRHDTGQGQLTLLEKCKD